VRASVTYSGPVTAVYEEPVQGGTVNANDALGALSVGTASNGKFDPYYGQRIEIGYSLTRPAWVTMGPGDNVQQHGFMAKLLHDDGVHTYAWSGHSVNWKGLLGGDWGTGNGAALQNVNIAATQPPASMLRLSLGSASLANVRMDPNTFFPAFGEVSRIAYDLQRDALVTIRVYDTTSSEAGTLFWTVLQDQSQLAGHHEVAFDGRNGDGLYARFPGTYTVEILAADPNHPTYADEQRAVVRILY
jgi:hypothetical protein